MRIVHYRSLLAAAAAALLGACSSSTEVRPDQQALDAATEFQSIAYAAATDGADPDVVTAYYNIAGALSRTGRISPITLSVDGTPLDFLATAQQMELQPDPACAAAGSPCRVPPPLRSVIAWQKSDPRRIVQFTTFGPTTAIDQSAATPFSVDILQVASLAYFDGAGGVYRGTGGGAQIPDPATSDTPCWTNAENVPTASSVPNLGQCTRAEFTASVFGTVAPPPFAIRGNTASGTHTIAMASQTVHGARIVFPAPPASCFGCDQLQMLFPPITLRSGNLRATLATSATASLVTFQLSVTNPQTAPVTVQFSGGQQFDFRVRRLDGSTVWTWSDGQAFTDHVTSRSLAAGETVVYTATWTPTSHGSFVADGWLTSSSNPVTVTGALTIP